MTQMTRDELRELIRETVQESVRETLLSLGIDAKDPVKVQRDFQFVRDWRMTTENLRRKAVGAAIGVLAAALLAALWVGIKSLLGAHS